MSKVRGEVTAVGILLADLGNGGPAAVEGRVALVVSKEGDDSNGKQSR